MGVTPNQTRPDGAYILGGMTSATGWNESSIKEILKGAPIESFTSAQTAHNSEVKDPLATNTSTLGSQAVTATGHEARITVLENGDQIAAFETNATWSKPAGSWVDHRLIGIGGAGSGARPDKNGPATTPGGFGGGRGGYHDITIVNGSIPSTMAVVIGVGAAGASANNTAGTAGTSTTINTTSCVAGGGSAGSLTTAPTAGSGNQSTYLAHGGWGFGWNGSAYAATAGGPGYLAAAGTAGDGSGTPGGNGVACPVGSIGPGSGGGGGGSSGLGGGTKGGNGGFPGGAGGGGGVVTSQGITGNGGNAANGKAWIISQL